LWHLRSRRCRRMMLRRRMMRYLIYYSITYINIMRRS
jgi:hypothetical protein